MPSYSGNQWGFTNDAAQLAAVAAFRDAAAADGWEITPTYPGHEPADRAATLTREGFKLQVLTRTIEPGRKWKYEADINGWAPDQLGIKLPRVYSWDAIKAAARHCNECGADDVDTERFYFAGRACAKCAPAARARTEVGNWTE